MLATDTKSNAATHLLTVACLTTQRGATAPSRGTLASPGIFIALFYTIEVLLILNSLNSSEE